MSRTVQLGCTRSDSERTLAQCSQPSLGHSVDTVLQEAWPYQHNNVQELHLNHSSIPWDSLGGQPPRNGILVRSCRRHSFVPLGILRCIVHHKYTALREVFQHSVKPRFKAGAIYLFMLVTSLFAAKTVQATLDEARLPAHVRHVHELTCSRRLPKTRRQTKHEEIVR